MTPIEVAKVMEALKSLDYRKFPAWSDLSERFAGLRLYAGEFPELTLNLEKDGRVVARGNILVSAPTEGLGGRMIESSFSVPATVEGVVQPGGYVDVSRVAVTL